VRLLKIEISNSEFEIHFEASSRALSTMEGVKIGGRTRGGLPGSLE
jgi:hypothetical protein